ncbi:HTH-type transcriptional regulator MalT [compost metagenome]
MTDHIAACHQSSAQQLKELEPDQYLEHGVLSSIVAYCMIALNQYDDARQIMSQAMQRDHQLRTTFIRSLSDAHDGSIDLIQARLGHALSRLESSYERVWMTSAKTLPGGKATVGVPLAEVLYELDELERAQRILGECLAYARENGTVDALITSFLLLSRIALAGGDRESALRYLKELEAIATDSGLQRAGASAQLELARLLWLEGDLDAANQKLEHLKPLEVWQNVSGYQLPAQDIESPELMHWRLRIAMGEAHPVVAELKHAIKAAMLSRRYRRALKLRILLGSALMADNKPGPALQTLTETLQTASKEGFIRTFLDEGPTVEALLLLWFKQYGELAESLSISTEFLVRLRAQISAHPTPSGKDTPIREALTRRELEVLRHLAEGARNRTMAERMFVSETTIKAHLRNISAKLGANSRTEAVAIARREGLI